MSAYNPISRLKYTKVWTNPDDFPTVETDETHVRADQQLLFDEVKEHVNKVAEELDYDLDRAEKRYATKDELAGLVAGQMPDGSVTVQKLARDVLDRSYTREETWSTETRADYGYPESAVPDTALSALSPLLHNWWVKKKEKKYKVEKYLDTTAHLTAVLKGESATSKVLYYADSYAFDEDTGRFRLIGATSFTLNWQGAGWFSDLAAGGIDLTDKYISEGLENLEYLVLWRSDSVFYVRKSDYNYYFTAHDCDVVVPVLDIVPDALVHSVEPDKFSTEDGYASLKGLVQRAALAPKMAWGVFPSTGFSPNMPSYSEQVAEIHVGFDPVCIVGFGAGDFDRPFVILPQFGTGCVTGDRADHPVHFAVTSENGIVRCTGSVVPSGYYFAIGL